MHWPMKHTNASSSNNSHRCIVTTTADAMSKASSPHPRVDDSCCDCDTLELEVTITVISLGGVVAKKYESKKSSLMPKRRKKQDHLTPATTTTSVVASFCQAFTSDGTTPLTHVPSIPIENLDASCMSSTSNPTPQPIIHWPGMPHDDDDNANQVLSTLRFSRQFDREDDASSQGRFMPQTCPINVSISRHGHLIGLGKANVIIVGEENGVSSTVVPVSSTIKKVSSRYKSSIPIPMIKIKGDDLMFGLKSDAMLRVLVSVSKVQTPEKDVVENPKSFCVDRRSSDPESDDNIAVVPEPQSVVCDNAITESGIKGKELVNAREEMQLAEPKEVRVRSGLARVRSTTVMRGSLFGEEPERQEKAEANDSQDVEAAAAEAEDIIPDFSELDETTTSLNVVVPSQTDANNDRDLDTALSFCVLSAILGSPAPSCVKKHGSGSKIANPIFWDLEDDIEDNIPDLHFDNSSYEGTDPPHNHKEGSGLNDTFTTASLSDDDSVGAPGNNEEELIDLEAMDIVPDIDIVDESCEYYHCSAFDEPSIKKAADSALAWSALALILHSPAPAAVTKFGSSPKNLDDSSLADLENELFTIQEVEEEASLPSLTDTAESPPCSPERKQREYMFKDSLDDNEFLPEIEAMANRIERCPYCKLLYCQEFPCSMRFKMEHEQQQPSRTYKEALMRGGD